VAAVPRSKTAVPLLPPDFVPRDRLVDALDAGAGSALTIVCAPPGYGKTLVLADWVRRGGPPCAWVALGDDDDDPHRLWTSVLAALLSLPEVPPSSGLRSLAVPRTTVGPDFLTDLSGALGALPAPIRLVLDDVHHLRDPASLHGLEVLLRHRPDGLRLVLGSRVDPALPLARLRLEDRLCELRTDDLALSAEETAALAAGCGLRLTAGQNTLLHARTGGWVAGVRLAALPLRDHPDPQLFLDDFSGDERPVADYLADEVFSTVSPEQGDFLRRICITDPVPTALAAELSGRPDAADLLADLEHTTGLVVAAGPHRTEFRVHELMRSYLLADLQRHGSAPVAELHRRAAEWWSAAGRPVEALRHAAQAGSTVLLTDLLHQWAAELVARGDLAELRRVLAAVEPGAATSDPWLPLISAQVHLGQGNRAAAHAAVCRGPALPPEVADVELRQFHDATAGLAGVGRATGRSTEAPPPPADTALAALHALGRGASALIGADPTAPVGAAAALGELDAALSMARDQHLGLLEVESLCLIGVAAAVAGEHARAASAATAAIAAAAAHGWRDSAWTATAHAVLSHASLAQGAPTRALAAAVDGLGVLPAGSDAVLRFALRCGRGAALCDVGDRQAGLLELQDAQAERGGERLPAALAAWAALLEDRAALRLGLPTAAASAGSRLSTRENAAAERLLMRSWSEAASGCPGPARATVAPLLTGDLRPLLPSTTVEAWLVEAWGAMRMGDRPAGRAAVQAALALAEPMDLVRPFAVAGAGVRALLVDQLGGVRDPSAFTFRCLTSERRPREPLTTPLSAREQDVLAQLVSLSNLSEIADDLAVSVNTVKSHVRAIYGKLGVSTRRAAVMTALEHSVLT
jgi:LuxR family transcriptional regulator, maltose regulon positive regulatory protein